MAAQYVAKRRQNLYKQHVTYMHHVAWGIVCILLLAVVLGLLTQAQTLSNNNSDLRRQLAAAKMPSTTCRVTGQWQANTTKQLAISAPSGSRDYFVHTPKDFADTKYYPLLMFYPGRGASAQAAEAAYKLDALPAVVVYPTPTMGAGGMLAWQGAPYSSGSDDIGFTTAILDKTMSDLCIDRTKVYAAGMSNGGGFTSLLSCKLSSRFAAYAIVSGALYYPNGDCTPPRPSPLISIHGDQDQTVPYDGSVFRKLPPVDDWIAARAAKNGCNNPPTTTYSNGDAVATVWNNCKNGASVENVRIEGGIHAWGQIPNEQIWQFLSRFSL
ncbi:MAG: putative polyhydroxybutyrate depolymerase, polyhydroxybutyrate depolymerase [Candidatus Saccharibacteria bacterium]|nr:putative polyhydroxybutyrate depolymerase, polyhydroxybutyrate depolymerase [Candidatus Saccharibacteria bacterium]